MPSAPPHSDRHMHPFQGPGKDDVRSVCPALNAIANHSYIPHNGKEITFSTLVHALHSAYGVTIEFACFLVLGTYILLKRNPLKHLDLHEVGRHDAVEHNSSVVHEDADDEEYAPSPVDAELLDKFLSKAYSPPSLRQAEDENEITVEDVAHTRIARQMESGHIDKMHAEIARGEFAMVFNIFGKGANKALNKDDLEVWLKENRFPDWWVPNHEETLMQTVAQSKKIRELMKSYQSGLEGHKRRRLWSCIEEAVEGLVQRLETAASGHQHRTTAHPDTVVNGRDKHE